MYEIVKGRAMRDHLFQLCEPAATYSMPRSAFVTQSMSQVLREPATKRARRERGSQAEDDDVRLDIDDAGAPLLDPHCFFKVVIANPSRKKMLSIPVGSGGKIPASAVAVTFHQLLDGSSTADSAVVGGKPCTSDADPDPTFLLQDLSCDVSALEQGARVLQRSSVAWGMPSLALQGFDFGPTSHLLSLFMDKAAYPGDHDTTGLPRNTVPAASQPALQAMLEAGYAQEMGAGRQLALTPAGVRNIAGQKRLTKPTKFFAVRADVALHERTQYELVILLERGGWSWKEWAPPSRRRAAAAQPVEYRIGEPKVWYTTVGSVPHSYMVALLKFEDVLSRVQGVRSVALCVVARTWCDIIFTAFGLASLRAADESVRDTPGSHLSM